MALIMEICPCGSNIAFEECCGPLIGGVRPAVTAEELMRSRYSAYVRKEISYLLYSLHPDHRADFDEKGTRAWAEGAQWHGLEIVDTVDGKAEDLTGKVEFIASYSDKSGRKDHHELAAFEKKDRVWFFVSGGQPPVKQIVRSAPKTGRNDPCPCGSGRKYKKCCASG
jgi:SEC-C motif-containing protein